MRRHYRKLMKGGQAFIACFETLAHLALAMMAKRRLTAKRWKFCLPTLRATTPALRLAQTSCLPLQSLCATSCKMSPPGQHATMSASKSRTLQARKTPGLTNSAGISCTALHIARSNGIRSRSLSSRPAPVASNCTRQMPAGNRSFSKQAPDRTFSCAQRPLPAFSQPFFLLQLCPALQACRLAVRYASTTPDAVRGAVTQGCWRLK